MTKEKKNQYNPVMETEVAAECLQHASTILNALWELGPDGVKAIKEFFSDHLAHSAELDVLDDKEYRQNYAYYLHRLTDLQEATESVANTELGNNYAYLVSQELAKQASKKREEAYHE